MNRKKSNPELPILELAEIERSISERIDHQSTINRAAQESIKALGLKFFDLTVTQRQMLGNQWVSFQQACPQLGGACAKLCHVLDLVDNDESFRYAIALSKQSPAIEGSVWVAVVSEGKDIQGERVEKGEIKQLRLALYEADLPICAPVAEYFNSAWLAHSKDLCQTMREVYASIPNPCVRACLWSLLDDDQEIELRPISGNSFTAAAAHAWNLLLSDKSSDPRLLILAEYSPNSGKITDVKGVDKKVQAALDWKKKRRKKPGSIFDKIVAVDDGNDNCGFRMLELTDRENLFVHERIK